MPPAVDWTTAELPSYDALPSFKDFRGCAWDLWGPGDQLGTVNLLTASVVKQTVAEEIRTGQTVSLNWPLNYPEKPLFGRLPAEIKFIQRQKDGLHYSRDDEIHINTQSGSQWDGLRHFPVHAHEVFYNNTLAASLSRGIQDSGDTSASQAHIGIQNWAEHGICGRGVLLDLVRFMSTDGVLSYDPWTSHAFTVPELEACAKAQGVEFRRGDILMLRAGFIKKYNESSKESRDALAGAPETFAGIEQSESMKQFLWNNHFSAIASDQPSLERWPTPAGTPHMHQTILGLWGMPIGEMFDLEKLSQVCDEQSRYTFFVSSWPLNIIGGAASPPNAAAFF